MILIIFSVIYSISVKLCDFPPSGAPADQKHLNLLCIITVSWMCKLLWIAREFDFSWKFIKFTGFHEILCFPEDLMFFAKRLPLCQHAKIAIIPKGFHRFWSQLLPKMLKKHPGMHFTVFFAEFIEFIYFSEI